jgi:hypothetical protein
MAVCRLILVPVDEGATGSLSLVQGRIAIQVIRYWAADASHASVCVAIVVRVMAKFGDFDGNPNREQRPNTLPRLPALCLRRQKVNLGRLFRAVDDDLERSSYTMTSSNACKKLLRFGLPCVRKPSPFSPDFTTTVALGWWHAGKILTRMEVYCSEQTRDPRQSVG